MIEVNWKPDRQSLRSFGGICLVAFGLTGLWIGFRHTFLGVHMTSDTAANVSVVLFGIAGACGVASLAAPKALFSLYIGLTLVSLPFGFLISHVVLFLVYFLILTPVGLMARAIGYDPLTRAFDRNATSYWVRRHQVSDVRQYFRQF